MRRHVTDPYVRQARTEGYRSRAAYKLEQLDARDRLLRPGLTVLDLGSAPGGWSQLAASRVGRSGRVIAVDLLEMAPVPGVRFIQGDLRSDETGARLSEELGGRQADLVISDMAPNLSGIALVDQARAAELAMAALEMAQRWLKPGGDLVVKAFQGSDLPGLVEAMRASFRAVAVRKPGASRGESSEVYLVARQYRGAEPADMGAAAVPQPGQDGLE